MKTRTMDRLALEIAAYCKKWGMWESVQIFTENRCYFDKGTKVGVRPENNPAFYTEGAISGMDGEMIWKDFSNPERILDMTFEGPLSLLLRYGELEVKQNDLSEEAKEIIESAGVCLPEYERLFYDNGKIADIAKEEFTNILEKYGLWYELGFTWSLTTYRI